MEDANFILYEDYDSIKVMVQQRTFSLLVVLCGEKESRDVSGVSLWEIFLISSFGCGL